MRRGCRALAWTGWLLIALSASGGGEFVWDIETSTSRVPITAVWILRISDEFIHHSPAGGDLSAEKGIPLEDIVMIRLNTGAEMPNCWSKSGIERQSIRWIWQWLDRGSKQRLLDANPEFLPDVVSGYRVISFYEGLMESETDPRILREIRIRWMRIAASLELWTMLAGSGPLSHSICPWRDTGSDWTHYLQALHRSDRHRDVVEYFAALDVIFRWRQLPDDDLAGLRALAERYQSDWREKQNLRQLTKAKFKNLGSPQ